MQNFKLQQDLSREHQQQRSATVAPSAVSKSQNIATSIGKLAGISSNSPNSYGHGLAVKQVLQSIVHSSSVDIILKDSCSTSTANMSSVQQQQHSPTRQQTNISPSVTASDASEQLSLPSVTKYSQQAPLSIATKGSETTAITTKSEVHDIAQDMNVINAANQGQQHESKTISSLTPTPTPTPTTMVKSAYVVQTSSNPQYQATISPTTSTSATSISPTKVLVAQTNTTSASCGVTTNVMPASAPITNPVSTFPFFFSSLLTSVLRKAYQSSFSFSHRFDTATRTIVFIASNKTKFLFSAHAYEFYQI